jgi:hypothetical protein
MWQIVTPLKNVGTYMNVNNRNEVKGIGKNLPMLTMS